MIQLASRRANQSGEILVTADRFRSQQHNSRDALARLDMLLGQAWRRLHQGGLGKHAPI